MEHLFREFAEFEASAASYLAMLDGIRSQEYRNKPEVNLLSPLNCRRLLITMRDMVVKKNCRGHQGHQSVLVD